MWAPLFPQRLSLKNRELINIALPGSVAPDSGRALGRHDATRRLPHGRSMLKNASGPQRGAAGVFRTQRLGSRCKDVRHFSWMRPM